MADTKESQKSTKPGERQQQQEGGREKQPDREKRTPAKE